MAITTYIPGVRFIIDPNHELTGIKFSCFKNTLPKVLEDIKNVLEDLPSLLKNQDVYFTWLLLIKRY